MLSKEVSVKAVGSLQVSELAEESRVSQEQASLNFPAMLCDWSRGWQVWPQCKCPPGFMVQLWGSWSELPIVGSTQGTVSWISHRHVFASDVLSCFPPFSSLLFIMFEFSGCLWILFPNINKWKQQRFPVGRS